MSVAQDLKKSVHDRHLQTIRDHFNGRQVSYTSLWLAVGFFSDGAGRRYLIERRPFSEEEWRSLLQETDREDHIEDDPYF